MKFLFESYLKYTDALQDTEVLIKALKLLPQDLVLREVPVALPTGMPQMSVPLPVRERIPQLERDSYVIKARLQSIREEIINHLGGQTEIKCITGRSIDLKDINLPKDKK